MITAKDCRKIIAAAEAVPFEFPLRKNRNKGVVGDKYGNWVASWATDESVKFIVVACNTSREMAEALLDMHQTALEEPEPLVKSGAGHRCGICGWYRSAPCYGEPFPHAAYCPWRMRKDAALAFFADDKEINNGNHS